MRPTQAEQDFLRRVTDDLSRRVAPVVFSRTETATHRAAIFSQRYDTIQSRRTRTFPEPHERIEHDDFDESAIHIQGRLAQSLVASARIVLPAASRPLPLERNHGFRLEPSDEHVEIGRTIVNTTDAAITGKYLFAAMLGYALTEIFHTSHFRVAASANAGMLRVYRRMGFVVKVLGPAKCIDGEDRYPVSFDLVQSAKCFSKLLHP